MNKEKLTVETNSNGTIRYRNADGEIHNPHGPAVVCANGCQEYWIHGEWHNENGPAIVWPDGDKKYWINDKELTKSEFTDWQAQQSAPLHNTTANIDGIEYTLTAK